MTDSYLLDFIIGLTLVLVLVLLNGFFVAAEFAIVKIRETQLVPLINRGHPRAKVGLRIIRNLDASLSATQLGITLSSLGLGWFAEPVFAHLLNPLMDFLGIQSPEFKHSVSFAIGFSVITFLHIVAGELAPKSMAIQKPLPTTLFVARPLAWFYKISYPFIWLLNHAAQWILRLFGIRAASEAELVHSEEELRLLFGAVQKQTGGSALGRAIVLNALDLGRRLVRDVMTPRNQIVGFDTEATIGECLSVAEKTRYSRFPLCEEGDLNRTLGVVHFKDLFAVKDKSRTGIELQAVARKLIYLPEMARLEKLLQLFLERKLHMAIVVDEYGDTQGMVTLEDILEELVGQIQDEFDQEKPLLVKLSENEWEIDGSLPLHELAELMGEDLQEEGVTTTSGWVTHRLGGFPKVGDTLALQDYVIRVDGLQGLLVAKLRLTAKPKPAQMLEE